MPEIILTALAPILAHITILAAPRLYQLASADDPDAPDPDSIAWRHPTPYIALTAAVAAVVFFAPAHWTMPTLIAATIFIALSTAGAWIDYRTTYLPDAVTLTTLWAGLALNASPYAITTPTAAIIGAIIGYLLMRALDYGIRLAKHDAYGIANGDAKLFAAIGAWAGWLALYPALMIAISTLMICRMLQRQTSPTFPFGPALAIGGLGGLLLMPVIQARLEALL